MKTIFIISLIGVILLISLVSATYTAPTYTNVTIVLKSGYIVPSYTNVTIYLPEPSQSQVTCWTKNGNIVYVPNGCIYQLNNGGL
jgi:hypothetical protein